MLQFEGGAKPLATKIWITEMEKLIDDLQYPRDVIVRPIPFLKGNAKYWWTATRATYKDARKQQHGRNLRRY